MKKQNILFLFFLSFIFSNKVTAQIEFEGPKAYGQIFDVIHSKTQKDVIYALTLTNHVVTSTDGGETWDILYSDPLDTYATLKDLRLISDGATLSFNVKSEGSAYSKIVLFDLATASIAQTFPIPNPEEFDVLIDSYDVSDSNNDVAVVNTTYFLDGLYINEVFYTSNGGVDWESVYNSEKNYNVVINNVSISPEDDEKLFLMRGVSNTRELGGVFISVDAGKNWENKIPGNTYSPIAFNPDNSDDILLGTYYNATDENVYRSLDGGDTWAALSITWTAMSTNSIHDIQFNPNNSNEIIVLEENEIVVSSDNGSTWTNYVYTAKGPETYYYGLYASYNPFTADEILISANYYPFITRDGGKTLDKLESPFIFSTGTVAAFSSVGDNHVYYGMRNGYIHKDLQTDTEEDHFLQALNRNASPTHVFADPVVSGRVFTSVRGFNTTYISVSSDYGDSAIIIESSSPVIILEDVSSSIANPNISWISTGLDLKKVDLTDMENIIYDTIATPEVNLDELVKAVQVDSENENTIFIAKGINFYKSYDGGVTWAESIDGLEGLGLSDNLILDIEQNPLNANQLMIATTNGIYLSEDKGDSWLSISSEFTNNVTFSTIDENTIVGVTHYSGGFEVPLPVAKAKIIISTDLGVTWEEISPEMLSYPFTENSAFIFTENEISVYLGVQDLGLVKYDIDIDLNPLSVKSEILNNNAVTFYPNPTKNSFSVNSDDNILAVTIYTVTGQEVKKVNNPSKDIDVNNLESGAYLVKVKTTKGTITKRILKSN